MLDQIIENIAAKKHLESYVLNDNPLVSYYATAYASHDILYKLINVGTTAQKINVIEHGSSKHVKLLQNDYNPVIRNRADIRAKNLEKNIFHEYVTAEKLQILLNPYSQKQQLDFFEREMNPFIEMVYNFIKTSDDIPYLMCNEDAQLIIMSSISLDKFEIFENMKVVDEMEEIGRLL